MNCRAKNAKIWLILYSFQMSTTIMTTYQRRVGTEGVDHVGQLPATRLPVTGKIYIVLLRHLSIYACIYFY